MEGCDKKKKPNVRFARGFKHPSDEQRLESTKNDKNPLFSWKGLPRVPDPTHQDDWLAQYVERVQTFSNYRSMIHDDITQIFIVPIGHFNENVLETTREFTEVFFGGGMSVQLLPPIEFKFDERKKMYKLPCFGKTRRADPTKTYDLIIPHRRCHPYDVDVTAEDHRQFSAEAMLTIVQSVRTIKGHSSRVIGLTMEDLFQGSRDSFVVGLAGCGVCVSSMFRYLEHAETSNISMNMARVCVHELMHCLQIEHCILTPCLMNGAGRVVEDLSQPLSCCPCCLKKLLWKCKVKDPVLRYHQLIEFYKKQKWTQPQHYLEQRLKLTK